MSQKEYRICSKNDGKVIGTIWAEDEQEAIRIRIGKWGFLTHYAVLVQS